MATQYAPGGFGVPNLEHIIPSAGHHPLPSALQSTALTASACAPSTRWVSPVRVSHSSAVLAIASQELMTIGRERHAGHVVLIALLKR